METQRVLYAGGDYTKLDQYLTKNHIKRIFLVCGGSIRLLRIGQYFDGLPERLGIEVIRFSDFAPNPLYESVVRGVHRYQAADCDLIAAVGGGSAMDVAKCIKLFAGMDSRVGYLTQPIVPNAIRLLAVPTTAGSGSEATRYAVIYDKGEKCSVSDESCIPSVVVMDADVLETLPLYQKKSAMLDALCHAIESFWSVNGTAESKAYAKEAIGLILTNADAYLVNDRAGSEAMLRAANLAGRAINITQTTAGHAMCYKLTGLYGLAHGHAAALCVSELFPHMIRHTGDCIDSRGEEWLRETLGQLAHAMGCRDALAAAHRFTDFVKKLALQTPHAQEADYALLKSSVNAVRLKNHPIRLTEETIDGLYRRILGGL